MSLGVFDSEWVQEWAHNATRNACVSHEENLGHFDKWGSLKIGKNLFLETTLKAVLVQNYPENCDK